MLPFGQTAWGQSVLLSALPESLFLEGRESGSRSSERRGHSFALSAAYRGRMLEFCFPTKSTVYIWRKLSSTLRMARAPGQVFSISFEAEAAPLAICLNCSETTPN